MIVELLVLFVGDGAATYLTLPIYTVWNRVVAAVWTPPLPPPELPALHLAINSHIAAVDSTVMHPRIIKASQ